MTEVYRSISSGYRNARQGGFTLGVLAFSILFFVLHVGALAQSATEPPKSPEDLIASLSDASYREKAEIVRQLSAVDEPYVVDVLIALREGALYVRDGAGDVVIAEAQGERFELRDPATGESLGFASADELKRIRINNRVRGTLRDAIAKLSLFADDAATRLRAAEDNVKVADPDALPLIEEALKQETNKRVARRLDHARAAIVLKDPNAEMQARLEAIDVLVARGDAVARTHIAGLEDVEEPALAAAAQKATRRIDRSLSYWSAAQNGWYGLSLASVLLLAATGLAITFGVMGVINMAHGEMVMLGAYTTYLVQQAFAAIAPDLMGLSILFAIPAAFLVSGGVGIGIERGVIRFLYNRPLETLLATWGVSLILQQTVRSLFGPTNKQVIVPDWLSGSFEIGQLTITFNRLGVIILALSVFALLILVLSKTYFGLQTRAVTQNRRMAASMGIRTEWIDMMTFGLGSGVAGVAGVALSQIDNVSPNLGQAYIVDCFMVVVFGGASSLWGTLIGALSIGVTTKFMEPMVGAVLGKILILIFIILFIQARPRGLFALKGRSVES